MYELRGKWILGLTISVIIVACLTGCPSAPSKVMVPNIVGMTQSAAELAVTDAGLVVGIVTEQYSDTVPAGQVISHDPAAGVRVARGSAVTITLSKGTKQRAEFIPGEDNMYEPVPVDAYGATLRGPAQTPIQNVVVDIPAGALHDETTVRLGHNDGEVMAAAGDPSGIVLDIDSGEVAQFDVPIRVVFQYAETGSKAATEYLPIPYHISEDGSFHLVTLVKLDRAEGTATFETYHASWFTWILEKTGISTGRESFDTGYRSGRDGFQITNQGSTYNSGGECFGMSAFSLWYYDNHATSAGDFYSRFMGTVGSSGLTGQDIIATRAHLSISRQWSHYQSTVATQNSLTEREQMLTVRNGLRNTENPVMLYLAGTTTDGRSAAHAVLASAYKDEADPATQVNFSVYDPNRPNQTMTIKYDTTNNEWKDYSYDSLTFTQLNYMGDGSFTLAEPFTNILEDADGEFHSDSDAVITITSHSNGQTIRERSARLQGTIQSGEVLITKLNVSVDGQVFAEDIGLDGGFDLEIPIQFGENRIRFETRGENSRGDAILVNNNMTSETFELIGSSKQAAILVTLTWDKNDTDVDLYVIDPHGDCSWYYNKVTRDGGVLDVDDINGYGPEHWTLTYEDTVRWDQDYLIRLHYYSDHENGPTNYTVTILLDEGKPWQTLRTFTGTLVTSNSLNDLPTNTGADWVNIAVVRPTRQTGKFGELWIPDGDMPIDIVMPVPSPAKRLLWKQAI